MLISAFCVTRKTIILYKISFYFNESYGTRKPKIFIEINDEDFLNIIDVQPIAISS
jgi:hypothetical protein